MKIQRSALSLNVDDPEASAAFLARHFGFSQEMAADGFVSMGPAAVRCGSLVPARPAKSL